MILYLGIPEVKGEGLKINRREAVRAVIIKNGKLIIIGEHVSYNFLKNFFAEQYAKVNRIRFKSL